jgi:hypothetical protein
MPEIKAIAELLDQVGSAITFPDPLGELRARGFMLAPDVQAKLDAAGHPSSRLDPAKRQQLATLAGVWDGSGPRSPGCRSRHRALAGFGVPS